MQQGSLYLHPPLGTLFDTGKLLDSLRDNGFLDELMPSVSIPRWRAGDEFHNLISFMGCSPNIVTRLEHEDNPAQHENGLIYIECRLGLAGPLLITGENSITPICRHCKTPLDAWRNTLPVILEFNSETKLACPTCGRLTDPRRINWRKTGGVVRDYIRINNIFPFEAVPSERLMQLLKAVSDVDWKYFYTFHTQP